MSQFKVFSKCHNSSPFPFSVPKKYQYLQNGKCHLSENGPRIFLIGLVPGVCVCSPGGGGGGLPYEKGGDAGRLA